MTGVLLRGGRPWEHDGAADILVRDGAIAAFGRDLEAAGAELVDIPDRLVLPGLVDAHCHLDKTLCGGP